MSGPPISRQAEPEWSEAFTPASRGDLEVTVQASQLAGVIGSLEKQNSWLLWTSTAGGLEEGRCGDTWRVGSQSWNSRWGLVWWLQEMQGMVMHIEGSRVGIRGGLCHGGLQTASGVCTPRCLRKARGTDRQSLSPSS